MFSNTLKFNDVVGLCFTNQGSSNASLADNLLLGSTLKSFDINYFASLEISSQSRPIMKQI